MVKKMKNKRATTQIPEQTTNAAEMEKTWAMLPTRIIPAPIPMSTEVNSVELAAPRRFC